MNRESMAFVVYMIHKCANRWHLPPSEIYKKMEQSGCIHSYLVPHYEVLHTQSSDYVLEDIPTFMRQRGIAL